MAKEKEEEIKEKTLALQQELEKTRAAYEEKKKKDEEIKMMELEDYRKQQKFNKRMELINKIDECKKIIIIAVCIALVPLILIVTNLES
jgi:predicted nuclease with TOPRIM domain